MTSEDAKQKPSRTPFPPLFWLVILFEFFERGAYYGVMSVLSVYLTDHLHFAKTDVGLIKGTIQPLLYFLPIISGALADRFGYRRTLLVAFGLLGGGYLLTSQATGYAAVFLSLVVMGIGAGTFKPVISGTIARSTDETNSTLGFGIFYWTINLGAFLVPLFLVPFLKNNIGWNWVLIAAGLGTGAMLVPTFLLFREPPKPAEKQNTPPKSLLGTLASAFEILYSPVVLLYTWTRRSPVGLGLTAAAALALLTCGVYGYSQPGQEEETISARVLQMGGATLKIGIERNQCLRDPYTVKDNHGVSVGCRYRATLCTARDREVMKEPLKVSVTLNHPDQFQRVAPRLLARLQRYEPLATLTPEALKGLVESAHQRATLRVFVDPDSPKPFALRSVEKGLFELTLRDTDTFRTQAGPIRGALDAHPTLAAISTEKTKELVLKASSRSFLLLFVGLLFLTSLLVLRLAPAYRGSTPGRRWLYILTVAGGLGAVLWLLPQLSLFTSILCSVIAVTVLSLFVIDTEDTPKFWDHSRFLLMIVIYSGFWILYFQMFDSVLWYVKAYVDAEGLNQAVNGAAAALGFDLNWRFDIEHVTVINAGTIILLQLIISHLVKSTRALPTMIAGITLATGGMAILAISTGIWTFIIGITIFSIGEMTAHPKFIAYVGQTAPKARVATYMGYLFLYGVIGASIGGVLGASLYVDYVDRRNDPQTLWLIFTAIGVATIVGLLLFHCFIARPEPKASPEKP